MTRNGLIPDYRHALDTRYRSQSKAICDGKVKNFEDYREQIGILKGLRLAREDFDRLVKINIDEQELED